MSTKITRREHSDLSNVYVLPSSGPSTATVVIWTLFLCLIIAAVLMFFG